MMNRSLAVARACVRPRFVGATHGRTASFAADAEEKKEPKPKTGKKLFIASVHAKVSSDNDKISFALTEKIFDASASFPRPRVSGRLCERRPTRGG